MFYVTVCSFVQVSLHLSARHDVSTRWWRHGGCGGEVPAASAGSSTSAARQWSQTLYVVEERSRERRTRTVRSPSKTSSAWSCTVLHGNSQRWRQLQYSLQTGKPASSDQSIRFCQLSGSAVKPLAPLTRKPCCRKETARCHSCSFWLKVRRQHHYKFKKPSFESQAAELQTYRHKTQFNSKWRFKVIQSYVFWRQWKGDKALSYTT